MLRTRPFLVAALACAATLTATAPAGAAIYEAEYDVELEMTGTNGHYYEEENDSGTYWKSTDSEVQFSTRGTLANVVFRDGKILTKERWSLDTTGTVEGGATVNDRTWNPEKKTWTPRQASCTAKPLPDNVPFGKVELYATSPQPASGVSFDVRFAQAVAVGYACTGDAQAAEGYEVGGGKGYGPVGAGTFDGRFSLPAETVGMGTIIQHVQPWTTHLPPEYCPHRQPRTTFCTFTWTGKVTFTRTGENHFYAEWPDDVPRGGEQPPAPILPPVAAGANGSTSAATGGTSATGPRPAASFARVVAPKRVVVHPNGRKLTFAAVCPGGCTGTATLKGAGGSTIATRSFAVKAGAKAVTVAAPKRALRRARSVVIALRPAGGKPVTTTLTLKRS